MYFQSCMVEGQPLENAQVKCKAENLEDLFVPGNTSRPGTERASKLYALLGGGAFSALAPEG